MSLQPFSSFLAVIGERAYTGSREAAMFDHAKRSVLQYIMNRYFLTLRHPPGDETGKLPWVEGNKESRAKALVDAMTLEEKISYISGIDGFCIRPIERLGIPPVWMGDATSGVRGVAAPVTIFPSAIAMAATWNSRCVRESAAQLAGECRATGISILLAPGVNIARLPVCGRNFEYLGEDPFLAGRMACAYVDGVQSKGVGVTVKHFVCNNSEFDRHKTNSIVDERTLRELYLPAFEAVVKGGATGVMTAYNQVNGTYASANAHVVQDILRSEWGFEGIVVSDWNSLYETEGPLRYGVDIEMPKARWFTKNALEDLVAAEPSYEALLDAKILRMLSVCETLGVFDRPVVDPYARIGTVEHHHGAYTMASESIVLLKNEKTLPLEGVKLKNLVVLGRLASREPIGGGGSSFIKQGYPGKSIHAELGGQLPGCKLWKFPGAWWRSARRRAVVAQADAVIVATGFDHVYESEAYDRQWELPNGEVETIRQACLLNARTVVVLHAGGALEMDSWIHLPHAVLHAWYLGESSAQAIADVLLGKVNPSGKLPISIARSLADHESVQGYPPDYASVSLARVQGGQGDPSRRTVQDLVYREGLMVGYRQFDTVGPEPLFPFGFGLSYTRFAYRDLEVVRDGGKWVISCSIENCGDIGGAEVVQLYVRPSTYGREHPFQQLRGFEKAYLGVGGSTRIVFSLGERDFSEYAVALGTWEVREGDYRVAIGSSSRDIRLEGRLEVKKSPDHGKM